MCHWIIEDKGFGGTVFTCSKCKNSWNDIYHSGVGQWTICPSCHERMEHDKDEYALEKDQFDKLKESINKVGIAAKKASGNLGNFANIHEQIARNTQLYNDKCNQIVKLEFISGKSIDELIELFSKGYVLVPSTFTAQPPENFIEKIDEMVRAGYFNAGQPVIPNPFVAPRGSKKSIAGILLGNSTEVTENND